MSLSSFISDLYSAITVSDVHAEAPPAEEAAQEVAVVEEEEEKEAEEEEEDDEPVDPLPAILLGT